MNAGRLAIRLFYRNRPISFGRSGEFANFRVGVSKHNRLELSVCWKSVECVRSPVRFGRRRKRYGDHLITTVYDNGSVF